MIEPEVTAVLGRRFVAFLIDSSLVVATGLGVALQQSSAFAVVGRDPNDQPLVDPAEFTSMEELLDFELFGRTEILGRSVVRSQEIGDSVRVFGEQSYQSGLLAAAVAALVLFGLVPLVLHRTIGMLPVGLGVRKLDGTKAGFFAHVFRAIGGLIDAIPFAIPGLFGFILARASSHRQRLGDRLAKTAVVRLKHLGVDESRHAAVDLDLRPAEEPDPAEFLDDPADRELANAHMAETATEGLASAGASAGQATMADAFGSPPVGTKHMPSAASQVPTKPGSSDHLPPPPVHRKSPAEHPLGTPLDPTAVDAPIGGAITGGSERGAVANEAERRSVEDPSTAISAKHLAAQTGRSLEEKATEAPEVPDDTWSAPTEEPAPVWQPKRLETAPLETPDPHDGRTLDDVTHIDPSIGALLSNEPAATETAGSPRPGKHSQGGPTAKAPVWSDKWRAWMYWDSTKKCWLRHDTKSNTWLPVD